MSLSYPTLPGDIDHLLADDHAIAERQFQHLEAGVGDRRTLVDQLVFELALHAFAEETVLYPVYREIGMTAADADSREDHQAVKEHLVVLSRTEPGEPQFEQTLTTLIAEVRHHLHEEETSLFPTVRDKVGPARMAELGKELLAAKRTAPPMPHPHAPDDGKVEKVLGALTKPLDTAVAAITGKNKRLATDASGYLDGDAQAIVDAHSALGPQPFEILTPEQARSQPGPKQAVEQVMTDRGLTGPEPVGTVEDLRIPDAAGGEQTLRVYKPAATTAPTTSPVNPDGTSTDGTDAARVGSPIVFWIHGGGWVLFTIDDHYDASCRGLCNKTGAIVVTPDYRRAPEAVFPASHDDVLTAYRWVREHAVELGGDPHRIAIGGESVGGNMAAATIMQLAQADEKTPSSLVAVYPLTTAEQFGDSMTDAADARPLNRALLSWMAMHAFEGHPEAASDPRIDLLGWDDNTRRLLPPTLVITAERDVLRSQGLQFATDLNTAGVPTTSLCVDGTMHEFFGAAAVMQAAEQAQQTAAQHLLTHFGIDPYPNADPVASLTPSATKARPAP